MPDPEVVDLQALAARAPRTDAEQERLEFCGRVVEAATSRWFRGLPSPTPLACGECPDRVVVTLSDTEDVAEWRCRACGRRGMVREWRGTHWDLTLVDLAGAEDLASWLEVEMPLAHFDALVAIGHLTEVPRKVIHGAQAIPDGALLHAPFDALVVLRDVVAASAAVARTRGDEELLREAHALLDAALDGA